ncbi:MAG TPA: hypothetical protein VFD43_05070, partial [Planctomycetota bacterium]|nr:hypothetical protein [Planctomycetota bacterium]
MLTPAPLLLVAFALHAQSADFLLLGKDHAKFARELYEAGYVELAETLCTRIENSPNADPAEVASVRSVHLDLKIAQARTQKDPRAKLTAMTQLLKQKEEFIEAYPDAPEARDALQTLPDVYAAVGEAFAEAVKAVQEDPGEAKRLRAEGSDIFRRGEAALADQVEQLTAAADEPDLPPEQAEAIDLDLMAAKYNLARTFFFHATLLGKDDPFGETFLDRSIDAFEEFGLLYSDRLLYFEGQVFQGQAHAAKGETDDALASFDECIGLKDTFGEDEPMPAVTIQVVAWGIQKKIELLTELKRYEDAIATADDFLETVPGAAATRHDLAVLDARMTAEVASGDSAAAQATAQLLVDKDPNGWYGDRGQAILGNLVASGSAGGLGQKNLLKIAQSLAAKKDYEQALKLAHQAIAASRSA